MNLPPAMLWLCPTCLVEADDTFCPVCGRPLTKNDLTTTVARATSPEETSAGDRPKENRP